MKTEKFHVSGMTCAACQANVTRCVQKQPGVESVDVSLLANRMTVTYDETKLDEAQISKAVEAIGYGAAPAQSPAAAPGQNDFRAEWRQRTDRAGAEQAAMKTRLIASAALLVPLMYLSMGEMIGLPLPGFLTGMENMLPLALTQFLLTVPVLFINRHFFTAGLRALFKRAPNMDSLVAVGSGASLAYGVFALYRMAYGLGWGDTDLVHHYAHALYFESAATILTLVTVGKYLETRSKAHTSDALGKLVDLAPRTAVVVRDGLEQTIPSEQLAAGDIVVIRPGESVPADGVVTEGRGYLDQAAITGESLPVEKAPGDEVITATINRNGAFRFRASRVGQDTTLAQIIRLVDEAGSSRAPIARLADKVSGVLVPVVIGIALLTLVAWLAAGQGIEFALNCAVSVLVISCPCALGLATPVAIMVGTGRAAEQGILIKSAESLENLHSIDTIVLDKTGTITEGKPAVTDLLPLGGLAENEFLADAATLEAGSEHPLAAAVVEHARAAGLALETPADFTAEPGLGVAATIRGQRWLGGNAAFLQQNGVDTKIADVLQERLAGQGKTPLLFARDGVVCGVIAVADTVRPASRQAVRALQALGLRVVMLTGDNRRTAEAIRADLGIAEVVAEVLPAGKEAEIRRLQGAGHKVAMVGDGVNDAPALVRADIGIAIGAGTDIALDSADLVLMKSSLADVVTAIRLSRAVIRNIHQNLFWAFFYNILGIPLAAGALFPAFGLLLSPMIGSAAMSLSSVCVVTNALRLRRFRAVPLSADSIAPTSAPPAEKAGMTIEPTPAAPAASPRHTQNPSIQPSDNQQKGMNTMQKIITVEGMSCDHCRMHVEKALSAVEGVRTAAVSLADKTAIVTLDKPVDDKALTDAVDAAGYTAVECHNA